MCNGIPFTVEKFPLLVGLELGTARPAGQGLTHSDTGVPIKEEKNENDKVVYHQKSAHCTNHYPIGQSD